MQVFDPASLQRGPVLYAARADVLDASCADQYRQLLSVEELERNARYRRPADRQRDLVARALVRSTLGNYLGRDAASLGFRKGEHGKPLLDDAILPVAVGDSKNVQLQFNLSHAGDWIVLAVSADRLVGVDIESSTRNNSVLEIADRYFFGEEIDELMSFPDSEQRERFFDYWTLKEAFMKARGEGISLGLDKFGFRLREPRIEICMDESLQDDPARWTFHCATPLPGYRLALAYQSAEALPVTVYEVQPLREPQLSSWTLLEK